MAKHDCPYCQCEDECEEGHCLHYDGFTEFCCRCPYRRVLEYSSGNGTTFPRPGCKMVVQVIY